MHHHRRFYTFLLIFFLLISVFEVRAQKGKASLSGTIFLPVIKTKKKASRGSAYRSRYKRSSRHKHKKTEKKIDSPLLNVIVYAKPLSFDVATKPMQENAKILQFKAKFYPHVVPITRGTVVEFINKDRIYHNVFSVTPGARFNIGRRPQNEVVPVRININGEIKLFCDIHSHMNATILSLDTPYFTRANERGEYKLENLPDGVYEVTIYHPDFDPLVEKVEIKNGQAVKRNFRVLG
jgi:plastocyanin